MDKACARFLNQVNSRFYEAVSASFSETRTHPWPGWEMALNEIERINPGFRPRVVVDFACGNLRFEKFLKGWLAEGGKVEGDKACANVEGITFHAFDNCAALVGSGTVEAQLHELDIVEALIEGKLEEALRELEPANLAVSFGFFHHIPGYPARIQLLKALLDTLKPGGFAVISLWQFMNDPKLAAKAHESHASACLRLAAQGHDIEQLDENDWLLGWQDTDAVRYCHHFTEEEIASLALSAGKQARLVADFASDGKSGVLNRYLVFEKIPSGKGTQR